MRSTCIVATLMLCLMAGARADNYNLVWSDEFNGDSLDTSKWQYEVNCDGGGNNELECYTNSPSNLKVNNGTLILTALKQSYNGKQYTSARINTKASAAWKYGRFEVSAKLPNGIYLWPALWMMPRDSVYGSWAASGEIDIMENRGGNNFEDQSTLHFGGGWPNNIYQGSGPQNMPKDLTADFHKYVCIWTPDSIQFLVDDYNYYTISLQRSFWNGIGNNPYGGANQKPFDQYFYFIINLAVGGGFFGSNSQALTSAQAASWANPNFYVDYVRVYQLGAAAVNPVPVAANPVPVATPTPTTSVATPTSSNGCAAGVCGTGACCNNQCYDSSAYSCSLDSATNSYGLCGVGMQRCNGACFNPTQYHCVGQYLQQGPAGSSSTFSSTSTAAAVTSSTSPAAAVTPQTVASKTACNCGAALCCPTAQGNVCYSSGFSACVTDNYTGGLQVCGYASGQPAASCNLACYDVTGYKCVNGKVTQK